MDVLLKRMVRAAAFVLLAVLTLFVWRLSVLVHRLDGSVAALSEDVRNAAHEASQIASEVGRVRKKLSDVEELATNLLDPAAVLEQLPVAGGAVDAEAANEIQYLLDCIGRPGLRYEYGDDNRPAVWVQAKLTVVYRACRGHVETAEDFIDKVATETLDNETYYVIENGNRRELRGFLTEALERHRSNAQS